MVYNTGSLNVKVVPDSSPLEGGGQMVLVFYNDLPPGNKFVMFISRQRNNQITVETTQENSMVLYALIPRHEIPETVILQVYCEGCVLAQSEFTYYANTQYNSDQLFHYLVQNMPQYFQMDDVPGAMGGMGGGGAGGGGGGGSYGYYGNIPASTYGLLLGACRLGLEPLVYHTLQINSMSKISGEQLQKAYSCCHEYGHQNLSDCLKHLVRFTSFVSRDPSQESPMGEGLQKTLSKLDSGGEDPLAPLRDARIVQAGQIDPLPIPIPVSHSSPPPSTTATTTTPHTSTSTTSTLPSPSQQSRRLSSTKLQKQDSVKDPDDDLSDIHPHAVVSNPIGGGGGGGGEREKLKDTLLSRGSSLGLTSVRHSVDQELQDSLHPLPRERFSMRGKKGHLISAHSDDNDSAVSMSFDRSFEDHDLQREIERRMSGTFASSGLFSLNLSDTEKAVDIAIDPAASYTFAHSLQYECVFMVTEDYPSGEEKTIFRTGDRILAVGDTSVRGKGPDDFQELLENESSEGTTVKILPRMERSPPPSLSLSLGSSLEAPEKKLHRRQSEQQMLDAITMKVTNLLSMKASRKPRSVVIPSSPEGFGFKVIGGNAVGLFVSEVKPGQKEVSQGDQILEINGQDARHMTHFEATQLLRSTRGKVHLTVMDNGAKFTTIRDQFEFDSFYLRTLVDNKDLQLKSNTLMRVVNTFLYSGNQWLAWVVDEHGTDCELRKIPSPSRAKRICGKEVYQEVNQPYRAPSPMLHPQGLETTVA